MPAQSADDEVSPFAAHSTAGAQQAPLTAAPASGNLSGGDAAAVAAAEGGDDLSALPDAAGRTASATAGAAAAAAIKTKSAHFPPAAGGPGATSMRRKKMIPLKRVVRDSYEYHGLNDLFFFCITALAVTLVLYWHWGATTATFKANVQSTFQQYGNPDWQSQSLQNVDTMFDAVEYATGWMEFWLSRASDTGWPNDGVRVGEFGDVQYLRMLVNLERNCYLGTDMLCYYSGNNLTDALRAGQYGGGQSFDNILDWAGWQDVGELRGRDSSHTRNETSNHWWSYAIIAPLHNGKPASLSDHVGRLYNITRDTNLNYNSCDWAAHTCEDVGPFTEEGAAGPNCAQSGGPPPFQEWWASPDMCASNRTRDVMPPNARYVRRGNRYFVRDPEVTQASQKPGTSSVLDLKPFLSKYAYSITLEVLASNAASQPAVHAKGKSVTPGDMALFTMAVQRSALMRDKPDRIMWQITTTLPVRTAFYSQETDTMRILFEVLLHLCLLAVLSLQVWQITVCHRQHGSWKPWAKNMWNWYELLSNLALLAWVVFYWALVGALMQLQWSMSSWDVEGPGGRVATDALNSITTWAAQYSTWLYMGIVVDFLVCLRLTRYMRIHVGLKAFYQVFIIAAREFLDFAVFLFYILVLLGSAVFAFFQLTGGNFQFLRFPDGLSLMSRLTFGFLSYDEFQSQALGVGAATHAVTGLFWLAVLLLVVYTQNIILAIVAEAYEEAKAKLGTAKTSFLLLVVMRILFTTLFIIYRMRMLFRDMMYACTGWRAFKRQPPPALPAAGSGSARQFRGPSPTSPAANGRGGAGSPPPPPGGSPDDDGSSAPGASSSSPDLGAFGSAKGGYSSQWGSDDADAPVIPGADDDLENGLVPQQSRAVLPPDVEMALAGSSHGRSSTRAGSASSTTRLLSSFALRTSSAQSEDPGVGQAGSAGGSANSHHATAAAAGPAGARRSFAHSSSFAAAGSCRSSQDESASLRGRLGHVWHEVILGERHMLRMYNDVYLAPGKSEDSWVTSWKSNYWRPWCVARTAPLRCLMNLYQDFGSYKLKEDCTWLANSEARKVIAEKWRSGGSDSRPGSPTGSSSKDLSDTGVFVELPQLADEVWVTEDELARLFLVTSEMTNVLKIWQPPFHKLTNTEVQYLVRGIAEVYGQDEGEWRQQQQQLMQASSMQGGGGALAPAWSVPSSLKDARLGSGAADARKGGFFSGLNQRRRDVGSAEHGRQVSLLLHANKRLEELTNRNALQLNSQRDALRKHMEASSNFQRSQRDTTDKLLRALQDMQKQLMHSAAMGAAFAGGSAAATAAAAMTVERSGSGVTSPRAGAGSSTGGPGGALGSKRFNSMAAAVTATGRMLGGKGGKGSRGAGAAAMMAGSAAGPSADDPLGVRVGGEPGDSSQTLSTVESGDSDLVLSFQQQLEQQQKALQLQQELLLQVLARLPPLPQPQQPQQQQ